MKKLCLCLALVSLLGLGTQASAVINTIDAVPAATLLLPYFEVDIADPAGVTTLFSINNASAAAVLAHVTVWSDQSVPVLDFDVYLTGYDVQTINLRDILVNGDLPRTASSGQDPNGAAINLGISPRGVASNDINYTSCTALPYALDGSISPSFLNHLQEVLQGNPSPTVPAPNCYGSRQQDDILRGYVTVDTVNACNLFFPSDYAFYAPFLTNQNVLWGDYFFVNSGEDFAQGETLVHIEACPAEAITVVGSTAGGTANGVVVIPPGTTCFAPGDHTFYGRYNGGTADDQREALPTTFVGRYLNGAGFDGGTDFLVWREGNDFDSPYSCALPGPTAWYPLEANQIVIFDEREQPVTSDECPSGDPTCEQEVTIPNEAQRVDVAADLLAPFDFGFAWLNLQSTSVTPIYGDDDAQAWVVVTMDAEGRFSVGFDAIQIDNANTPNTTVIPVGN
jgi:hypothetical protein